MDSQSEERQGTENRKRKYKIQKQLVFPCESSYSEFIREHNPFPNSTVKRRGMQREFFRDGKSVGKITYDLREPDDSDEMQNLVRQVKVTYYEYRDTYKLLQASQLLKLLLSRL